MTFKSLKKLVSILTLATFIATNSVYAGPESKSIFKNKKVNHQELSDKNEVVIQKKKVILSGEDANQSESQQKEVKRVLSMHLSDISLVHIPEEVGRIVEVYQSPNHDHSKLVAYIQDLHTNPEAELNLAKILEILLKDYNLGLVCSEGAAGVVDTSSVSGFPDKDVREKVARLFIDSGELTGEEYLSITKYPHLPIWGIEDKEVYFENIAQFNNIMKFNPNSQVFISQAKKALDELKPRIYSKELITIDEKESDFDNQKIETADYLKYLSTYIQKLNIPTANYRNISLLNETIDHESKIDQQKIMRESQNLLLNLESAIAGKSDRSDMDILMAKATLFKDQKISPFSFYSYLKDLANKHLKDQLSKYPSLMDFVDYLTKVNSLDSNKLFTEMSELTYDIKQRLARNDEEKLFTENLRNIKFLEGFFNLKVSNEELDYYLENKDSHKVSYFETFLKPAIKKYSLATFVDFNPDLIDSHLQKLEDFYKTAKSRDSLMFNNTISEIEKRDVKVSALVTGGFHTRGITQLLKDKGYSYIVISPYSKTEIDEENYHFLLSGKRKPIEELIKELNQPEAIDKVSSKNLRIPLIFGDKSQNQRVEKTARETSQDVRPGTLAITKDSDTMVGEKKLRSEDMKDKLASNENEKRGAGVIARKLQDAPLDAKGNAVMTASFLRGGYGEVGYGVQEGASIHGSFALKGNQGYYAKDADGKETGKQAFLDTVNSMRKFFERRAKRLSKPIKYVIKTGIGGQHTPFQGIADVFQVINVETGKVLGEYELGKDFESTMAGVLKDLNADWDQVVVIPSSKSGSTDETMMVFVEIFYSLLKHQAMTEGIDGEKFADTVLKTLHEVNFINGKECPAKDLFKVDADRFGTDNLITLISGKTQSLGVSREQVKHIFAKVLGNMFFETTDRIDQSRLSAFVHNSGLDTELGEDAPGFGAMFDNVGGRWTGDLHMMAFLAYHGLDAEKYWETRKEGIVKVKEGRHIANIMGNKILDEDITDIALLVPDKFFWFGKSNEQNFNESIWQNGFANLIAIKESQWDAQKEHYVNNPKRLVINMSNAAISETSFNVVKLDTPDFTRLSNQGLADTFAELFTTFYGMTTVVGDRLIVRALKEAGYTADDVDMNDVSNPATKIVQQNLYVRQPNVEFGKGFLEARLKALQEKEMTSPGAIEAEFGNIKKLAREGKIETSIDKLGISPNITNVNELEDAIRKTSEFAKANGRKFVPFIYLEGDRFYNLRDYLVSLGIEWVMQGTGDQHISYQQVLAQPQKYLPFIISFVPEKSLPGRPAIGFSKGYLDNVSPNMARDLFAEASYKALTVSMKDIGGLGVFLRITDSNTNIDMFKQAVKNAVAFNINDKIDDSRGVNKTINSGL